MLNFQPVNGSNGGGTSDILAQDTTGDIVALPIENGTASGSPTYVATPGGGWKFTA